MSGSKGKVSPRRRVSLSGVALRGLAISGLVVAATLPAGAEAVPEHLAGQGVAGRGVAGRGVATPVASRTAQSVTALDVTFSGTFQATKQYTSAGSETMVGAMSALAGTETNPPGSGIVLTGGGTGARFTASALRASDPFIAELAFTAQAQPAGAVLADVGGGATIRYVGDRLEYGFVAGDGSTHTAAVPLPAVNTEHTIAVAYLPGPSVTLEFFLDGIPGPTVSAGSAAAFTDPSTLTLGNDGAASAGFVGTISRARIATTSVPAPAADFAVAPINRGTVQFDTAFAGGPGENGTLATGFEDRAQGVISARGEAAFEVGSAVTRGGTGAIDYAAGGPIIVPEQPMSTPFVAELEYTATSAGTDLGTLFAAGGNLFVRARDGQLQYGFSSRSGGAWSDHVASAPWPGDGTPHVLAVLYEPGAERTGLTVLVDGRRLGTVTSTSGPSMPTVSTVTFGNEARTDAGPRGVPATFHRGRLFTAASAGAGGEGTALAPNAVHFQAYSGAPAPVDCTGSATYEPFTRFEVTSADCQQSLIDKASALRPSADQWHWQMLRQTAFLHFGINTFYDQEWGNGTEDPKRFAPTERIDTDQWAKAMVDAGFRQAIVVVKHHDGFLMIRSPYNTSFGVAASDYLGGDFDLLADFTASAKKYGLKVGVYLSTADSYQEVHGVFGNGSAKTQVTIPESVQGANTNPTNAPTFTYSLDDYNRYYFNVLHQVLTQYGEISEVWFDGAQGHTTTPQAYDFTNMFEMIKALQPQALTAITGRDIRWVGNEAGTSRFSEWSPLPIIDRPDGAYRPVNETGADLGSDSALGAALSAGTTAMVWSPAESDGKLTSGWFWGPGKATPLTPAQNLGTYLDSVGRNSVMLQNIPPATTGNFTPEVLAAIDGLHTEVGKALGRDLLTGASATWTPSGGSPSAAAETTDDNPYTGFVTTSPTGMLTVNLPAAVTADRIQLAEHTYLGGQQIQDWTVEALVDGSWIDVALAGGGTGGTVGDSKILSFASPVTASSWRAVVTAARGPAVVSSIALYANSSTPAVLGSEVYVDCSAPTAGDGSEARPFNSLGQLMSRTLAAGSTLHVASGASCAYAPLYGYGTDAAPITVVVEGGASVTVTAALVPGQGPAAPTTFAGAYGDLTARGWRLP